MPDRWDPVARINRFNRGRDPERLALKYKAMKADAFAFLRGSCHLFYEDWPARVPLDRAPAAWVSDDLHLENFGTYKGDNRLVYFDLSDFDEGLLAPCTWDLARFVTSVLVGAKVLKLKQRDRLALGATFVDTYAVALRDGKPRWVERATAQGSVRKLLDGLQNRVRSKFLDKRTVVGKAGRRTLRIDGKHTLAVADADRTRVERFMQDFATTQPASRFFKVLDVARRITGTGSLGLERYVVLVRGRGTPAGNFLLDLKYQPGSALAPYVRLPQPRWRSEGERAVTVQRRGQAITPALLQPATIGRRAYVLRELMPTQDKIRLLAWRDDPRALHRAIADMALLTAWGQLRSAGRDGSATANELIAFGSKTRWRGDVVDYAAHYQGIVAKDWKRFRKAYRTHGLQFDR